MKISPEDPNPSADAETVQLATIVSETLNVVVAVAAWAPLAAIKQINVPTQKTLDLTARFIMTYLLSPAGHRHDSSTDY